MTGQWSHRAVWRDYLAARRSPVYAALVDAAGQMRDNADTFPRDRAEAARADASREMVIRYLVADGAQEEPAARKAVRDVVTMAMAIRHDHNPAAEPGCVCPMCSPFMYDPAVLLRALTGDAPPRRAGHARARAYLALAATTEG